MKNTLLILCLAPFAASAGIVNIADLLQAESLCYNEGSVCIDNGVLSAVAGAITPVDSDQSIALNLTLTGDDLLLTGTGTVMVYNWDGTTPGEYEADLTFDLTGTFGTASAHFRSPFELPSPGLVILDDAIGNGDLTIPASFFYITSELNLGDGFVPDDFDNTIFVTFALDGDCGCDDGGDQSDVPEPATAVLAIGPALLWYGIRKHRQK